LTCQSIPVGEREHPRHDLLAELAREDAWLVRLAADGLWYSDLLGIAAPQGDDRRRLIARLLALAAGEAR
jgi:hypothetical protein